jgi:trigger factor
MNVSKKEIDALNAVLTVEIERADYEENVTKKLKEYAKKAQVPGFRPGKVPASLVKKMYGSAVTAEEINNMVGTAVYDYIKNNEVQILGEPMPSAEQGDVDFENNDKLEFLFDIAIAPQFDLKLDGKTKVAYYDIELTDNMVQDQVKMYTSRFGQYVPVEGVSEEKDIVRGTVKGEGVDVENAIVSPMYVKNDEQKAKFVGVKEGDTFTFAPKVAYENVAELSSFLHITKDAAEELASDVEMTFTVTNITRYQEAEVNQELFDKAMGEGVVKNEEEFIAKIKESLQNNLTSDADYKFGIDVKAAVMKKLSDLQFPDAFLKRWAKTQDKDLTDEKLEEDYPKMIEDLKWHLAKEKFAKAKDIKIEFSDVEAFAKKVALAQFAQYGMPTMPDDLLKGYVDDMMKDEKAMRNMMNNALEEKIIATMKDAVKLDVKSISIEDFHKMLSE